MHFRPRCVCGCLRVSFGWLISLGRIVRGCITEMGRGGACVPARVAPKGRIHRSSTRTMRDTQTFFGMETPLRGRSGGRTGTAPTCLKWNVPAGLIVHQGADVLAVHHALEVTIDVHVEHIDGQVVFLAHGGGGEVHHF